MYFSDDLELINKYKVEIKKKDKVFYEVQPNKSNFYCAICKGPFTEFLQHINSDMHLSNAKASIGMLNEIDFITKGLR